MTLLIMIDKMHKSGVTFIEAVVSTSRFFKKKKEQLKLFEIAILKDDRQT